MRLIMCDIACSDDFCEWVIDVCLSDVDECAESRQVCMQGRCKNTVGSFVCDCENGFSVQNGSCTGTLLGQCTSFSVRLTGFNFPELLQASPDSQTRLLLPGRELGDCTGQHFRHISTSGECTTLTIKKLRTSLNSI